MDALVSVHRKPSGHVGSLMYDSHITALSASHTHQSAISLLTQHGFQRAFYPWAFRWGYRSLYWVCPRFKSVHGAVQLNCWRVCFVWCCPAVEWLLTCTCGWCERHSTNKYLPGILCVAGYYFYLFIFFTFFHQSAVPFTNWSLVFHTWSLWTFYSSLQFYSHMSPLILFNSVQRSTLRYSIWLWSWRKRDKRRVKL